MSKLRIQNFHQETIRLHIEEIQIMKTGNQYHGFSLQTETYIREIESDARLFLHKQSGARLYSLKNKDDNKVFSITFKTPAADDMGIPHILEHSVLCGSRKFPVKEPFVELLKGSLNTFLNAYTQVVHTSYPFASRNEKDFMNLMDVYMDAVLFPVFHDIPEILAQEGWHYELGSPEHELTYNGVVYNEMKGVYSFPVAMIFHAIRKNLLPDTAYRWDSGGDPDEIIKLTQEEFSAFHKKYYHPSNAYIFLYGDGDLDKQLKFLNDEYLQHFQVRKTDTETAKQTAFGKRQDFEYEYAISPGEDAKDKTYMSLNYVVTESTDAELCLAFDIITDILLGQSAAPVKKALLDKGIGKDVFGGLNSALHQPIFPIIIKNTAVDRKNDMVEVVIDTLKELVDKGIDKRMIEASLNRTEFQLREADMSGSPKGLYYCRLCHRSWLHGNDPSDHLRYENHLEKIKSSLEANYFEKLIDSLILKNNHSAVVVLNPVPGLAERKSTEVKTELSRIKSALSANEIDRIILRAKTLKERQQKPDSPEDLAKIPMLSLSDIDPQAESLPFRETSVDQVKMLSHPVPANGIGYLNLYFDSSAVPQENQPCVQLLSVVLGEIGTRNFSYGELDNEINIHTGGFDCNAQVFSDHRTDDEYLPKFVVRSKALQDKVPQMLGIITEILTATDFNDPKRLLEIIRLIKSRVEMQISFNGHVYASMRMMSYFSPVALYDEMINGISFFRFISDIEGNFEVKKDEVIATLRATAEKIISTANLNVSFTSDEEAISDFQAKLPGFLGAIPSTLFEKSTPDFLPTRKNEGMITPGRINFVAKGFNFRKLGFEYSGVMSVIANIIRLDYLWNKVRVQGGAYNAAVSFNRNGNTFFNSYRDPHLVQTLSAFDAVTDYVNGFSASEREMTKYIIGTIRNLDVPLTPRMKGERSDRNYFVNLTQEDIQRERDEVLGVDVKQVRKLGEMFKAGMEQDFFAVVGDSTKLEENKAIFNSLVNIFD